MRKRIIAVCSITFLFALCLQCQNSGRIRAHIKSTQLGDSNIEYVQVSGLSDATVQNSINDELHTFAIWPTVNIEEDVKVTAKAKYAIIGNKYLSVCSALSFRSPVLSEQMDSQIFDLETGEFGFSADKFISSIEALIKAFEMDQFVQLQPREKHVDLANTMYFMLDLGAFDLYLTENSLGIYIPPPTGVDSDVTTDYVFEAPYSKIKEALTPSLRQLLKI